MGKLAQSTSKYCIHAKFTADGVVEKPDVIGAVFGQTEGLLGSDMDLRELQKTGRIGRVDVRLENSNGKTEGMIDVPSSLDLSETALIAAALETIERIGPCNTKINVDKIEDIRAGKRQYLVERAKELLSSSYDESSMESDEITEQIRESVRSSEIIEYKGLPAGPSVAESEAIIICEGRADVVKLLKNGMKNVIAVEGTSVPDAVVELSKGKEVTVFLDGDRGGDLILREILAKGVDVDFVARAPEGKEVEELSKKEIYKALREKVPTAEAKPISPMHERVPEKAARDKRAIRSTRSSSRSVSVARPKRTNLTESESKSIKDTLGKIVGTRAAYILDGKMNVIGKIPADHVATAIREVPNAKTIVVDGQADFKMVNSAARAGVKMIICKTMENMRLPKGINILLSEDLEAS